jgi:RND family efflux transporter MFP subunit
MRWFRAAHAKEKRMRRLLSGRRLWACGVLAILAGAVLGYVQADRARARTDPQRARREGRPIPVRTAQVTESQIEQVIGATAVTNPSQTLSVLLTTNRDLSTTGPVADLVIKAVHVHEGDRVKPGQVMFELEDEVFQKIVRQREHDLAAAQLDLERAERLAKLNPKEREQVLISAEAYRRFRLEDLDTRKREDQAYERLSRVKAAKDFEVFEAKSKLAQAQFEMTDSARRLLQAQDAAAVGPVLDKLDLTRAKSNYETAVIALELARRNLANCRIKSTLDGFVDRVELVPGQVVNTTTPLTQVFRIDPIHVRVDFPQERIDEVAIGQKAEVVLDSFPKETFKGKVIRIAAQANAQLRVLPVVVEVPNPDHRIKAGINGFVRIRSVRKATAVPALAIIQQNSKALAFCVRNGRAHLREVRPGHLLQTGLVEIRDGLAPGDEVVIFHNLYRHADKLADTDGYLQDNDLVDTDWRKWARRE